MGLRYPGILIIIGLSLAGLTSTALSSEVCGTQISIVGPHDNELRALATRLKIRYIDAFINIVNHIEARGHLPDCYLTKQQARRAGWSPGRNLWRYKPGFAIGGDWFGNREQKLPKRYNRHYIEADLDYDGNKRGAKRLVFVNDKPGQGLIWITINHYKNFYRIPRP